MHAGRCIYVLFSSSGRGIKEWGAGCCVHGETESNFCSALKRHFRSQWYGLTIPFLSFDKSITEQAWWTKMWSETQMRNSILWTICLQETNLYQGWPLKQTKHCLRHYFQPYLRYMHACAHDIDMSRCRHLDDYDCASVNVYKKCRRLWKIAIPNR